MTAAVADATRKVCPACKEAGRCVVTPNGWTWCAVKSGPLDGFLLGTRDGAGRQGYVPATDLKPTPAAVVKVTEPAPAPTPERPLPARPHFPPIGPSSAAG